MRILATAMLLAMAALFVVARHFQPLHPAWGYALAFAEAAMVGGLADWFAVTALFRRPLGLPIPHTAIIPENKDRIADTMAAFLRENFLTPQVIARRMAGMNLALAAGTFLIERREGRASRIRAGGAQLLAEVLESLDPERLGNTVRAGLKAQLDRFQLAPLMGQILTAMIADKRHLPVIDSIVRWTGMTLEANEDMVREMIHTRANAVLRWTGLDEKLANSVIDGLYRLLAEVLVNPDHPLRLKIEDGLEQLAGNLSHDLETQAKVAWMKRDLLDNPAVGRWWDGVWERIRSALIAGARDPNTALGGQLGDSLAELGHALRRDPRLQWQINRFVRRTAVGVASRHGGQIVQLVSETVRRWDARTVTDRIEGAVGRDLQFIRINGTLVGGLVGVTIHLLDTFM